MRQGLKVSLIIPVYNESGKIRACMDNIAGVDGLHEVIFADGGSTDGTPDIIGGRYRVLRCGKGRARQMNAAAKEAAGDILWFSHCDSLLPKDGAEEIIAAVNAGVRFGCFHIGFDYHGPFMGCNTLNSNLRARLWHIAFGDQGIFIDKDLFFEVNGFPDLPIMEDYELSRIMKRRSEKLYLLPGRIITSGRRYNRRSPLITMWQMFHLRCLYRRGVDIEEIARRYRDIR